MKVHSNNLYLKVRESAKSSRAYLSCVFFTLSLTLLSGQASILEQVEASLELASTEVAKLDTISKYIANVYYYGHFEQAYNYAVEYEALAKKHGKHEIPLLLTQAKYLMRTGKLDESKSLMFEIDRLTEPDNHVQKSFTLQYLARLYDQQNRLDSAIYFNYLADSVCIKYNLERYTGLVTRADIYIKQGQIQKGLMAVDEAYELGESKTDSVGHLWFLYRIASMHASNNSPEAYAKYAKEYLEYESGRKNKYHRGIFDLETDNREESIRTLEEVRKTYERENFARGIHLSKVALVQLYKSNGEYRKAYDILVSILDQGSVSNFENSLYEQYTIKYELEKRLGLTREALYSADKLMQLRDTMQSAALTKQTLEIEAQYQTREKEREIEYLNSENELKDIALKKANQVKYLFGLGVLLLGVLAISLLRNIRQKRHHNEELTLKNEIIKQNLVEKEDLLKEIHHRVKNNLQIVSSLLRLQSRSIEDEDAKEVLQEGQNRVQSMALIHQNLYKEENRTGLEVQDYFEKLCSNLIETYSVAPDKINLNLSIEPINLDVSTMIPLGLIVNELLTNSLKYAFPQGEHGRIDVALYEKDRLLHVSVTDNGIGLKPDIVQFLNQDVDIRNVEVGFGTRLIRTFAKKLDARIEAEGNNGTSIHLIIKDFKVLPL